MQRWEVTRLKSRLVGRRKKRNRLRETQLLVSERGWHNNV